MQLCSSAKCGRRDRLLCLWLPAILLSLAACSDPPTNTLEIEFELEDSRVEVCGSGVLSFYLSDPHLINANGGETRILLDAPSSWQSQRTVLISLAEACNPSNGTGGNSGLKGRIPAGDYRYLEFSLGVPFELNHVNPLEAEPPLDLASMFWVWQTGYKFLRYDIEGRWSFHLGSTGCHSASAVRAPAEPCEQPNLAHIRVPISDLSQIRIGVDLDALIWAIDTFEAENCVEAYRQDPLCQMLVERLGLDSETGQCMDECDGQVLFRALDISQ